MKKSVSLAACLCIALFALLISCAGAPPISDTERQTTDAIPPTVEPSGTASPSRTTAPPPSEAPKPADGTATPDAAAERKKAADDLKSAGGARGSDTDVGRADIWADGSSPSTGVPGSGDLAAAGRGSSGTAVTSAAPRETPSSSGLQAGFADDNAQFNYFLNFLDQYAGDVPHFTIPIRERIILKVTDQAGKPVPNARVTVSDGGKVLTDGATFADGTFLFFPSEYGAGIMKYTASIAALGGKKDVAIDRAGRREIPVQIQVGRPQYQSVPLDILFIMDTTGSMSDEIERLKATIEIINLNLGSLSSKPKVRFGMVLYRDQGDDYDTRIVPFTADLAAFQKQLAKVDADGGGDDPEDLQAALKAAVKSMAWDPAGIRLAFIITDAAPHLDYPDETYTYVNAAQDAKKLGIKIFTVGTGGLELPGELVLRQISQYTYAKYIFLTYGEEGESSGGAPGSVSHHTGANYQTDKLEAIVIRFAKEELSNLTDQPLTTEGDYFEAVKVSDEEKAVTLSKLFDQAIGQIIDYASISIPTGTPTGALPIVPQAGAPAVDAEYFGEQLILSLAKNRTFAAVERKNLQEILKEMELQMSGITDEANAVKVGRVLGAQMLLSSTMFDKGESFEIFLKLLRVETGEILSVTKLVVDKKLGLSASR
jgi:Mg-chelatase subunit ChlD